MTQVYNHLEDGVTHINIYSKGLTDLGRALSNLANISFTHPKHGKFLSLEGFWYWLSTGQTNNDFRMMSGWDCKKIGSKMPRVHVEDFTKQIKEAIRLKLEQNPDLMAAFKTSVLPFTHYYVFGSGPDARVHEDKKHSWLADYHQELRDRLNWRNLKMIIAGSRRFSHHILSEEDQLEAVRDAVLSSGYHVGEYVSGHAPDGIDHVGELYVGSLGKEPKLFPAKWKELGKRAGMVRNAEMAEYADVLVALWDGQSPGTKNMIYEMKRRGKPVYVVIYGDQVSVEQHNRPFLGV